MAGDLGFSDGSFPDGTTAAASNYCRNPNGSPAPWCYTDVVTGTWEYCDVPYCCQ